jgi:hypothetical protein
MDLFLLFYSGKDRGCVRERNHLGSYPMIAQEKPTSRGGRRTICAASWFPAEVAGVVLVDSSHPDQAARIHLPLNPAKHIEKWEPLEQKAFTRV